MTFVDDLRQKDRTDLEQLLREKREALRELRFKVAADEAKNVRDIRKTRKEIAQLLTILHTK